MKKAKKLWEGFRRREKLVAVVKGLVIAGIIMVSALVIWGSTLSVPSLKSFDERKIFQSTKIYDRTGEIILYDFNKDVRRTIVPLDDISPYLQHATIAIEDSEFYHHHGVRPLSFLRAALVNLKTGEFSQGGSTITQQVVKNSLLTKDKTITRKVKEWILAIRLEHELSKDKILEIYLNENPYGGTIYGVEEAARYFFGKSAKDVTLAQAAYLAALPQAPTYYSPNGNHRDALEERKNRVLKNMLDEDFISEDEYNSARQEKVAFLSQDERGIRAPHFVFYIRQYLEDKYGARAIEEQGLKVVTTLDYELQQKAEEIVKKDALENEKKFNASNAALVAIDPKTGQILAMVGSRDYSDDTIDGKYNVATSPRQTGSTFKTFSYATAFEEGYRPETVLFDLKTQFSTSCSPDDPSNKYPCYSPSNFDNTFKGPISMRNALALSINIPAIKTFYLAGQQNVIQTAKDLGITTLDGVGNNLSTALGSQEISPLEMTAAYSVFANDGVRNPVTGILRVEDSTGKILEEFEPDPSTVIPSNVSRMVTDVLSDNEARAPEYGLSSPLYFPGYQVAVKTGTTNDYKDAWIIGYTPTLAVGTWVGNNDSSSMVHQIAGFIVAPMWNEFMQEAFKLYPPEPFEQPDYDYDTIKPVLAGVWNPSGAVLDSRSDDNDEDDNRRNRNRNDREEEPVSNQGAHSILYWVDRDDPTGAPPRNPNADPQFRQWEYPIQLWTNGYYIQNDSASSTPNNPNNLDDDDINRIIEHARDLINQLNN